MNCYVHHREDLMTYVAPNVDSDTTKRNTDKPIVNISIWGDHAYFYCAASNTVGRCEMNRIAGQQANANPQLEYGKVQEQPERDQYSNCVIESPFRHEKMPPFDEWRAEGDLYHAILSRFENFREEFSSKKRKRNGHAGREDDGILFWAIDLHAAYEELKKFQEEYEGTANMIGVQK